MALNWPYHEFKKGTNNLVLYIAGQKLYFSQKRTTENQMNAYFYCQHKKHEYIRCKASAQALVLSDKSGQDRYVLCKYNDKHANACVPSSVSYLIKEVKDKIKERVRNCPSI